MIADRLRRRTGDYPDGTWYTSNDDWRNHRRAQKFTEPCP